MNKLCILLIIVCSLNTTNCTLEELNGELICTILGQSFLIGWRAKSWNPERMPSVVSLSVCARATRHTFWHRKLIFGLNDPQDMRKKQIFHIFHCYALLAFFLNFYPVIFNNIFIKSVKMKILKNKNNTFLSHVPRIIQPKN